MLMLLFVLSINVFIGVAVFLRNTHSRTNSFFLLLVVNICLWILSSYYTDNFFALNYRIYFAKAAFVFPVLASGFIALFSYNFPLRVEISRFEKRFLYIVIILGIYLSTSNLVVGGIDISTARTEIIPGKMYNLYTAVVLSLIGFAIKSYIISRKKFTSLQNTQAKIVSFGILISFFWALLFNLILPFFKVPWNTVKVGPIGTTFFVFAVAYAIIRHKLFDIRLAVARSLGYVLSVSALGLIYGFIAFNFISEILFGSSVLTVWQRTIYTLLAVLVAFTFQPLKKFFDRWTSKLFYQDAYDGQELIDELNRCLVSTINLQKLLIDSSAIISKYIKPEYCTFGLRETEQQRKRLLGAPQIKFSNEDFNFASDILPRIPQKIIIADTLDDSLAELQKRMRKNDVAVFARLTNEVHERGVGAIVLGPKKSGNAYNSQDVKVLEIVANTMVIAIQNAIRFEEIQKFNVTLEKKVIDATAKLKRANEKLILLDNTKDDFISMASHQLRTPLTSIKGYASMMIEGDGGVPLNKTEKKFMRQILFSSQQMVGLIGDLLNLSRLNSGKFSLQLGESHLPEMIYNQIDQLRTIADEKKIKFVVDVDRKLPKLIVDENKIQQVVMNMIDNAIYYTPENGEIKVSLQKNGKKIEFKVDDSGIGVPKDEQAKLFTRYFRAGNAKKFRPNGTGIGLYMAKKVIIEHKGAIIFKSRENRGSTFGFSLPL